MKKLHESIDPVKIIATLELHVGAERKATIERVLARRVRSVTVVLENLHDPHNGAAAIRSVEAFGLTALHVIEQAEPFRFSSKVTQGCEKWVAIHRWRDVAEAARALSGAGFALWAAVPGATRSVHEIDVSRPVALLFGNEHAGLSDAALAAAGAAFSIPMYGFTRSFNLSVSVALATSETARRRREHLGAEGDLTDEERLALRAQAYTLSMDPRAVEGILARAQDVD